MLPSLQGWTETSRSSHGGHRAPHSVSSARPTAEAPPGAAGRGFGQPPGGGRRRQVAGPGGTRAYPGQRADQDAWIMTPECQEGLRALAGGSGTDLLHKGIANFIPNCQAQGPFPKVPSLATLTSGPSSVNFLRGLPPFQATAVIFGLPTVVKEGHRKMFCSQGQNLGFHACVLGGQAT